MPARIDCVIDRLFAGAYEHREDPATLDRDEPAAGFAPGIGGAR